MEKTIFEKIIDREIPAEIVYEDEEVLAFLDVKPINQGHTLVVPKKKFVNILDADEAVLGHMMKIGGRIGKSLKDTLPCDGINLIMNNEAAAGQIVFHAHLHVIPRYEDDGAAHHPPKQDLDPERGREIAMKLRSVLQ